MKDKLPISEEFYSQQGEGMFTGVPSYFVRTSGCGLRCSWCDTPYTSWKPETKLVSRHEIIDRIAASGARHVVLTGGEPMLHPEQLADIIRACALLGKPVTVETSGVIWDSRVLPTLWSVSPKLRSATPDQGTGQGSEAENAAARRLHEKNNDLSKLAMFQDACEVQYKFVVTSEADVDEVKTLQAQYSLRTSKIWLMPEGRTAAEVMTKHAAVAKWCLDNGYNMSTRLHTLIWNAKRGV